MEEFNSLEEVAINIQNKLDAKTDKKKVLAIYAFNGIGKTRLSNQIANECDNTEGEGEDEWIKKLSYNAFFEDIFSWDNENYILRFETNNEIIKLVIDHWLEMQIIDNFRDIMWEQAIKLEPSFDFNKWEVNFKIASGDDSSTDNIKISRGEESIFVWSVFYTILDFIISELTLIESNRSTDIFNNLEYIIIDDPVSSIDDTRIILLSIKINNLIRWDYHLDKILEKKREELKEWKFTPEYIEQSLTEFKEETFTKLRLKFLITTHHALFFNVIVNSFKNADGINFEWFSLSKNSQIFKLKELGKSPFSYHLRVKDILQKVINDNAVEKYHFNLFRALLEKTAIFLGYDNWYDCVSRENRQLFVKLLNHYSHNKLSELEWKELPDDDKKLLEEAFESFITNFKWKK